MTIPPSGKSAPHSSSNADSAPEPGAAGKADGRPAAKPAPWVKTLLEMGPVIGFFIAYMRLRAQSFTIGGREYEGLVVVTAGFIPIILLSTLILWRLSGRLSPMQVMTAVLVIVFGGLTVWLNDPQFIKMKPTILYAAFAGLLGFGLWRGQSWLKAVMGEALPLSDAGWMILTRRFALFFVGLALANEVIWRAFSESTWVSFKTFGLPGALIVFMIAQAGLIGRHSIDEAEE